MAMTMKAAVVREFGKTIEEVPIPTPGAGEAPTRTMSARMICTRGLAQYCGWRTRGIRQLPRVSLTLAFGDTPL